MSVLLSRNQKTKKPDNCQLGKSVLSFIREVIYWGYFFFQGRIGISGEGPAWSVSREVGVTGWKRVTCLILSGLCDTG